LYIVVQSPFDIITLSIIIIVPIGSVAGVASIVLIRKYLKQKIKEGQYSEIINKLDFTKQLRKDFRHITQDKHIWIDVMENILITDTDVPIEEIIWASSTAFFIGPISRYCAKKRT